MMVFSNWVSEIMISLKLTLLEQMLTMLQYDVILFHCFILKHNYMSYKKKKQEKGREKKEGYKTHITQIHSNNSKWLVKECG